MWFLFRFLQVFLSFVAVYFVLQTFVVYWLAQQWAQLLFVVLRDGTWLWFVGWSLYRYRSMLKEFIISYRWLLWLMVWLIARSVWLSLVHGFALGDMIVWFKYDLWYLVVFVSALWLWYVVYRERKESSLISFERRLFRLVVWIVMVGVIWQTAKVWMPWLFMTWWWYGALWDFVPWMDPPLYYLTGSDGLMRLSGLFAGPNVLWFFLVLFWSWRSISAKLHTKKWAHYSFVGIYLFSLIATFSRGALVAFGLQLIVGLVLFTTMRWWKKLFGIVSLSLIWWMLLLFINQWKTWSSLEHSRSSDVALTMISAQPWWYGLWVAGPAQHYAANYLIDQKNDLSLVENLYMQLAVNIGLPWLFLLLVIFWLLVKYIWIVIKDVEQHDPLYLSFILLSLGLVALLIEWLVLHPLRDSMIIYLFFVPYGLMSGYIYERSGVTGYVLGTGKWDDE